MAILGMWMWPQNVQRYGAEKVVSQCARAGVTDLFFLVKGISGCTAFPSALAPQMEERDLLAELLEEAHKHGLRVHAWFTSACDENYKRLHPESGRCHLLRGKDRELISLADEGYLSYMENIMTEVSLRYEIDGLHLDYIRYNHLLYGWDEKDQARYAAEGADTGYLRSLMERMYAKECREETLLFDAYRAGDESVLALARARRRDVVHFASRLLQAARAQRSSLILSAALMPEGAYEDLAFSDLHYGQNYEDAAKLFNYALPMAYSKAYQQDAQWVRNVAEGTIRRGLKTIVGVHAYEGGTGDSLQADMAALRGLPVEGVCLFREGATAFAYCEGHEISIYNAMDLPVTGVRFGNAESLQMHTVIAPGEEKHFRLPFETEAVRVFADGKERCIYTC